MNWLLPLDTNIYKSFASFAFILLATFNTNAQSITSIAPTSGGIGTPVTITGTGFNAAAPNDIFFGPVKVTANANAGGTSIVVNVPSGASSYTPIIVRNNATNLQASSINSITPYYTITHSPALSITTVSFNQSTYLTSGSSSAIASGDFDNDGYADIAIGAGSTTLQLRKNDGLGNFPSSFPSLSVTLSAAWGIKTGDINNDGNLDLVVSKTAVGDLDIFTGNGDGTFNTLPSIAGVTGTGAGVDLEDINNDGYLDLITTTSGSLHVLIGDGTGSFTPATGSPKSIAPLNRTRNVSIADLNNDGFLDVVVPGSFNGTSFHSAAVLLNNQDETFADPLLYTTGTDPFRAVVGDYDGDGNIDIAALSYNSGNITTLKGDGTGGFIPFAASPIAMPGINLGLEQGDFDGDGILDLVVGGNTTNLVPLLKGDGTGGFASYPTLPYNVGALQPYGIITGDFNNDGVTDITFADGGSNRFGVLLSPPSFRTTWVTSDGQITIPTTGAGYNYDAVWSNLSNPTVGNGAASGITGDYTITGLTNGDTYQVIIRGDFPRIYFNNGTEKDKIRSVAEWGNNPWTSMANAFYGCTAFNFTATDIPNLSGVTDLSGMLRNATTFTATANLETWSVTTVNNMSRTFEGTSLLNRNMSSWDVSNVTDMTSMFDNSGYPSSFYDTTLESWDGLSLQSGVTLGAAGITYCSPSAITARDDMISSFSWTINDGGVCEPTTQSSNMFHFTTGPTQADIYWSNGDGANRIIVAKAGGAVDADPTDLAGYTANSVFGTGTQIGTGNYVIYNGTGTTTMSLTGLSGGTTYHFRAYEYNGSPSNENYMVATATGNPYNFATAALIPAITSFSSINGEVGTTVTIAGTNFNSTPANNIVLFGATRAIVTAATSIELTTTVPLGATYAPITVLDITSGLTAASINPFNPTFSPNKLSIETTDFEPRADFSTDERTFSPVNTDIDGDGKADIVVQVNSAFPTPTVISIFRNTSTPGTVSFAPKIDVQTIRPTSISAGDLDGDGKTDLVLTNDDTNTISVLRNTSTIGAISFEPLVDYAAGTNPFSSAIGDIDGDGKLDLAIGNRTDNTVSVLRNLSTPGTINFAGKIDFTTDSNPRGIALNDLDGDGKVDLATANFSGRSISILRNISTIGTPNFAAKIDYPAAPLGSAHSIGVADLDGDGKLDLVTANNSDPTLSVFRNISTLGVINFQPKVDLATGGSPNNVQIGDFDGDRKADIAVVNTSSSSATISVFKNNSTIGSLIFANHIELSTGPAGTSIPSSVTTGDVDGDGRTDIIGTNSWPTFYFSVYRNNPIIPPPPTITTFTPISAATGTTVTITGTNLTGALAVTFGGTAATSYTVVSATSITAIVDIASTSGNVSITTPGGIVSQAGFTFIPPPSIASFTPTNAAAGTTVTITGTNFSGATTVSLGGSPATSFTVVSPTSITAVVGTSSSGNVDVTTSAGTGSLPGFVFLAPEINLYNGNDNTGTALTDAQLTAIDFGLALPTNDIVQTFAIENTGAMPLVISNITVSGTDYSVSSTIATIAAGVTETFTVTLSGASIGVFNSTITIISNDTDENPFTFPITGVITAPEINVFNGASNASPILVDGQVPAVDFGSTIISNNITQTFAIENTGTSALSISSISATGVNYSVSVASMTVSVGTTKIFTVTLSGASVGTFNTTITIASNDPDENPFTFDISGIITPVPSPEIEVFEGVDNTGNSITDAQASVINIGNSTLGTDITRTFAIENTGTADLTIGSIAASGTDYSVSSSIATVGVGVTETFTVTLSGATINTFNTTITIANDDDDENPFSFDLSGVITSVPSPEIEVFEGADNTGNSITDAQALVIDVGTSPQGTDIAQTFAIENTGNAGLSLGIVSTTGVDYSVINSIATVAAGVTETFIVTLSGATTGTFNSVITIISNDVDENQFTFSITGVITAPEINVFNGPTNVSPALVDEQAAPVDFGSALQPNNITQTFAIENIGTSDLNVSSITASGTDYSISSSITNVGVGTTQTFTVTLSGTNTGTFNTLITIASDDLNENPFTFPITGVITAPEINVFNGSTNVSPALVDEQAAPVDFGSALQSNNITQTFSIENTGNSDLAISSILASGTDYIVSSAIANVAVGVTETFTVTLSSTNTGTFNSTITITNDDADENPFTFDITGVINTIPLPEINVFEGENSSGTVILNAQTNIIDIGNAIQGDDIVQTFAIQNTGSAELIITNISSSESDFTVISTIATVASGSTETFTVKLPGSNTGTFVTEINISSNDAGESLFTFQLRGSIEGTTVIDGTDTDGTVIISNQEVNIGSTVVNTNIDKVFVIENLSTSNDLIINSIVSNNPVFEVIDPPKTIAPSEFIQFIVRLIADEVGSYQGTLSVSTNLNGFTFIIAGEVLEGDLSTITVYNAVTPNGDGVHDYFKIKNLENFTDNSVKIYNRWGDTVYETKGYNNQDIRFEGISNFGGSKELDTGNYYYTIDKGNGEDTITGFIFLKR